MNAKTTGRNHDADTVTNTMVYRSVTIQKIQYQFVSTIYVSTDGSAIVRLLYLDLSRLTDHCHCLYPGSTLQVRIRQVHIRISEK